MESKDNGTTLAQAIYAGKALKGTSKNPSPLTITPDQAKTFGYKDGDTLFAGTMVVRIYDDQEGKALAPVRSKRQAHKKDGKAGYRPSE